MIRYWNRLEIKERITHVWIAWGLVAYVTSSWCFTTLPYNGGDAEQPSNLWVVWLLTGLVATLFIGFVIPAVLYFIGLMFCHFLGDYIPSVMSRTPPKHVEAKISLIEMRQNINQLEHELGKEITKW
jgi:hypothetical protein